MLQSNIKKWSMLELSFPGHASGNPFTDYTMEAEFAHENEQIHVNGFYDGEGVYRVRFMPSHTGIYTYRIWGSFSEQVHEGSFQVTEAGNADHGPVHVVKKHYLEYADGTPYYSIGTTCYAWAHQSEELQEQTLETLKKSCFNKIRFCVFPKHYLYNLKEPADYPYERGGQCGLDRETLSQLEQMAARLCGEDGLPEDICRDFDFTRFNVSYFQKLDLRIAQLCEAGIEADLILFHPYDRWGFAYMAQEHNLLYVRYMAARYGAYRNVWWSMANEYDLTGKTPDQWEELAEVLTGADPWHHMISIHNCMKFYDYHRDWITHCSMQRIDLYKHVEETEKHLEEYDKPVVWDEIAYEGNVDMGWGNISAQELVRRFWEASLRGGYASHGETYVHEDDILWWSHGGTLHGESEPRFAFLKQILAQTPGRYLKHAAGNFDELVAIPADLPDKVSGHFSPPCFRDYEIHYYGFCRPSFRIFPFPQDETYQVEVIDTWNMTVTDLGLHSGRTRVPLPGREYIAVRIQKR